MGIVNNLLRREKRTEEEPEFRASPAIHQSQPPLMLLLPDAGGIATYALNVFPHARAAEYYLDLSLRGQLPEGAVLFWALNWQPDVDPAYSHAEPLVVIRDAHQPVVYPFSFSDLESAFEFLRHEMKRGLYLTHVMVLWAVPARVEVDFWGRSTVIPPTPPFRGLHEVQRHTTLSAEPSSTPAERAVSLVESDTSGDKTSDEGLEGRYLEEEDIAEVVDMVQQLSNGVHKPAEDEHRIVSLPRRSESGFRQRESTPPDNIDTDILIDFSNASQRISEARNTRDAAVFAWANVCLAIDEALDVHVANQVGVKLAWNRIVRAIADALRAQRRSSLALVWQNGSVALAEAVSERKRQVAAIALGNVATRLGEGMHTAAARRNGLAVAWTNGAGALSAAGRISLQRKTMRRAWLNIAWTIEEAVYARGLEQKAQAIRAWRNATTAIRDALAAQRAYEGALKAFWSTAATAFNDAAEASAARQKMFGRAWSKAAREITVAVAAKRRMDGIFTAMHNLERAIDEAVAAQAWREQMIAAWHIIAAQLACAAAAKVQHDGIVLAWSNAAEAFGEARIAYLRKQEQAIRAWDCIGSAVGEALVARMRRNAARTAWTNAGSAVREAVVARARHDVLVDFWANAGAFFVEFIAAHRRHEAAARASSNAAMAIGAAAQAYLFQLTARRLWGNVCRAIGEALPVYQHRMTAVTTWNNGTVALKEALVAEAKMRIAQAGLDKELMADVEKAVKQAQRALKQAEKEAIRTAVDDAVATREHGAVFGEAEEPNENEEHHEEDLPGGLFPFFRATEGRWEPSEEPFRGFNSPRGRFHHRNRDDQRTA